ncbi:MAG: hypothetical protein MRY51_08220 [Flavobacteriaceae bacterium]|nr:hypothetical protein [Flavobacteriaceae bacterium]MCI5088877.1 hypothetical protein [Flavobacteriaceae bacterium]
MFEDPLLNKLHNTLELNTINSTKNVFHDLVGIIIEQQIHYRSTKKVFEKMLELADISTLTLSNFEHFEEKGLVKQKLSMNKFETLLRVIEFFNKNELDWFSMTDEEVRTQLTSIKGISDWTVDMILIYTLCRPDVFPSKDYHLQKILSGFYPKQLPLTPGKIKKLAATWSPNRSLAMRYLLATKQY